MVDVITYITRKSHKPLIIIPVLLMILSLLYLGIFGLNEGVDLKGGTLVTLELKEPMSEVEVTNIISGELGIHDVKTSLSGNTATVTISGDVDQAQFEQKFSDRFNIMSFKSVGALLSKAAMKLRMHSYSHSFLWPLQYFMYLEILYHH